MRWLLGNPAAGCVPPTLTPLRPTLADVRGAGDAHAGNLAGRHQAGGGNGLPLSAIRSAAAVQDGPARQPRGARADRCNVHVGPQQAAISSAVPA
eukprot:339798-Chlamydomonas_euryale.AAC.1